MPIFLDRLRFIHQASFFEALANALLGLVDGGDSHFPHSSHTFKVFSARDVVLTFIFKVFYGHIGKGMNVAC